MPEIAVEFELEHPPLNEMVLGIQFLPLDKWSIPHFGLFWEAIRREFPRFELKDPLLTQEVVASGVFPGPRLWFIDESETQVLQLQQDRLLLNWRMRSGEAYPRYQVMRSRLESLWAALLRFLEKEQLGRPQVTRCENSYINLVDVDALGSRGMGFNDVFPFWDGGPTNFLQDTTVRAFNMVVSPSGNHVQITVAFQPAMNVEEKKPVMQLSLTTLVVPGVPDSTFISLDLGHAWNIRAFKEFTSLRAQEAWGKK